MRVQEFVVSIVLPIDEESPALSDGDFMALMNFSHIEPYPNVALTFSQVRDATPQEAEDFAFVEDEEDNDTFTGIE